MGRRAKRRRLSRAYLMPGITTGGPPYLHHSVVTPRPSCAKDEFLHAAGGRVRVVQDLGVEYHTQFAQELFERGASIGKLGKFEAVAIDVLHDGLVARHD